MLGLGFRGNLGGGERVGTPPPTTPLSHPMATPRPPVGPDPLRSTPPRPPVSTLPAPISEPSPVLDPEAAVASESRMLPPHRDKLERVTDHVAAISADLREWVELRLALVKRQVEGVVGILERVQHLAEAAKLAVPGVLLLLIGLMFLLVTLALGIGAALNSYWLGFLIVTLLLMIPGAVLVWLGKRRYDRTQEILAEAKRAERGERTATREDIAEAQRIKAQQAAT